MLRRLCARFARQLVTPSAVCVYRNAVLAICLATWCLQLVALLGTSLPVTTALLAALALGIAAGAGPVTPLRRLSLPGVTTSVVLHFALAAWMVASPWLLQLIDWIFARPGFISLASPAWNAATLFALTAVGLGLPAFVAAQLACDPDDASADGPRRLPVVFLGAAAGLAGWGLGLAQIMGPYYCGITAAGLGLVIAAVRSYLRSDAARTPAEPASSRPAAHPFRELPALVRFPLAAALAASLGAWPAALDRLLEQLMPGTAYMACSEAIGLCLGLAGGLWLASRRRGDAAAFERTKLLAVGVGAVWGVGVLAAFPPGVRAGLWLNATVQSPTLHLLARGAMAGLALAPAGTAAALCLAAHTSRGAPFSRAATALWLAAAVCGSCALSAWAFGRYSPELVVIGLAWCTLAAAAPPAIARARELFPGWRHRLVAGGALGAIVAAPLWRANFDPQRSAKVLFNSNAFAAYQSGLDPSLLEALDDGRHVATLTGQRGICTVWRFGGHQLQIRENGIPRGVVSTDDAAFPRYVPETLQAALPMTLHDRPARLLLLGLGSSESLAASLLFPVTEITCLESDAGLVRALRETVAPGAGANPLDDERVALAVCDPALGLAAVPADFDVIVSSPEHLALTRAQPCLTAEFYRRAAGKLSPQGVFCQRLHFVDFGPRPLRTIVRTVQSVFRDVMILEAAPGDLLLAATNDDRGLIRPGLVARFELPHVRALLAQSGIDWSTMFRLGALDRQGLQTFTGDAAGAPHTAGNARLPFAMPREVMRWGPKAREVYEALGPARRRILDWVGPEGDTPVMARRLAEVQGQFELMTKFADQYWAYRASLRDQVKEKSRSQIQQVSATDEKQRLHPEDRRRLRYFQTLGRAVRSGRAADIERLVAFASPYDPLISYFVHEEAAELYARSPERDVARELRHRLHATFYSSPQDASLRNVVAALTLLREHPESEPDPQCRWDDLNALLQALKLRWEARSGVRPNNIAEAINDVDTTVLAAEQAFQALDELTVEAGLPPALWTNRRTVLEKTLVRPVKAYQQQLLPFLRQSKEKAVEAGTGEHDPGKVED
ncbi:MAG: spermidine synthase [Deltaproteobacteria bacterium]